MSASSSEIPLPLIFIEYAVMESPMIAYFRSLIKVYNLNYGMHQIYRADIYQSLTFLVRMV